MIERLTTAREPFVGRRTATTAALVLAAVALALLIARLPLPLAAGLVLGAAGLLITLVYPLFGLGVALLLGPFGAGGGPQ